VALYLSSPLQPLRDPCPALRCSPLQVVVQGEMIEYYDVSGCYILRPWSYLHLGDHEGTVP